MAARSRRTLLLTPGHRGERLAKAATLPADSLAFDLEDGVPPPRRAEARATVAQALRSLDFGPRERVVRINHPATPDFSRDLDALPFAQLDALLVPKVESAADLQALDAALDRLGANPALIVTLETPRGVLRALEIADASRRAAAIFFGPGDYTMQTGGALTRAGLEYPRAVIAAAAGAAGLQALDAPYLGDLRDAAAAAEDARASRELGFVGKVVFHPDVIQAVNAAFTPTAAEAARAARLVDAWDRAAAAGEAVAIVGDEFIAPDLIPRQRQVLQAAAAARSHDA